MHCSSLWMFSALACWQQLMVNIRRVSSGEIALLPDFLESGRDVVDAVGHEPGHGEVAEGPEKLLLLFGESQASHGCDSRSAVIERTWPFYLRRPDVSTGKGDRCR